MTPFEQSPGTTYWVSIQATVCTPDVGWAWLECAPDYYWNSEAVWTSDNPDPAWYVPVWTPPSVFTEGVYYTELSFRLITEPATPAEAASWGRVKALYR